MKNSLKIFALIAACIAGIPAARAGDLPQGRYGNYEPAYTPSRVAQGWTGFYAGAHAGVARSDFDTSLTTPRSNFNMATSNISGGIFGGHNWQSDKILYGLEADASMTNQKKDALIAGSSYQTKSSTSLTGRGRVGYVMDAAMVYGTAGLAMSEYKMAGPTGRDKASPLGWVVGVGGEVKLTPTTFARGEYLYHDFGKEKFALGTNTASSAYTLNTIRAGVGVRF